MSVDGTHPGDPALVPGADDDDRYLGVYVRDLNAPPPVDTSRQAARLFIGLVSSSVTAGVLGDRRDDRVYVRPAEAVEHARRRRAVA